MKVTDKGQITVPPALRERFGLQPGTEVEFVANDDSLVVRPLKQDTAATSAFDVWLSKATGSARTNLTTDQIMDMMRGED